MEGTLKISIFIMMGVIVLLSVLSYLMNGKKSGQEEQDSLYAERKTLLNATQKKEKMKSFSKALFGKNQKQYLDEKLFLSKTGANYYIGRELEPIEYFAANVIFAFIFAFCGYRLIGIYGVVFGIIGYQSLGWLLKESNNRDNEMIMTVFDPFHGSGTALYEAMEIDDGLHLVGCDINPLANLITRVKLQGVSPQIRSNYEKLKQNILFPHVIEKVSFPNIGKWLRKDIIDTVSVIKSAIRMINDDQDRRFFWVMFCDSIRKYSNTRSSTYKLHIKEQEKINKIEVNMIRNYLKTVEQSISKYRKHTDNFVLYKKDVLELMSKLPDSIFDISISSPPYGDNATTVPYGQFSMLALYVIDSCDLELEGWELDNYSAIDSKSMGGRKKKIILSQFEKDLIKPYLKLISQEKQEKVVRFFNDYFLWLRELCRVTEKYIVLTLGNRTVDRTKIDLTSITREFLEENNFKNIEFAEREIPSKRTPKITSMVDLKPVSSMTKEYIIVHKRVCNIDCSAVK